MQHTPVREWTLVILCSVVLALTIPACAEQRRARGPEYTKIEVAHLIQRVEESSDRFQQTFDRALDRSRLDGTRTEDRLNAQVQRLEQTINALREEFERRDSYRDLKGHVAQVLRQGDEVNSIMRSAQFPTPVEQQWAAMRTDLNRLADIYALPVLRG